MFSKEDHEKDLADILREEGDNSTHHLELLEQVYHNKFVKLRELFTQVSVEHNRR